MDSATTAQVKVHVPPARGAPFRSEGLWAEPVDLPAGLYRITSVAFFSAGVSCGDLVRCEVSTDGMLVAVEVLERAPHATVALVLADHLEDNATLEKRYQALADAIQVQFGHDTPMEAGMGVLSVCIPPQHIQALSALLLLHSDGVGLDRENQVLGDWSWYVVASPEWPTPEAIEGTDLLLHGDLEEVGVAWKPNDPVAGRWRPSITDRRLDDGDAAHDS